MTVSASDAKPVARADDGTGHWLELRFAGVAKCAIIPDRPDLRQGLSDIVHGWPFEARTLRSPEDTSAETLTALFPTPDTSACYDLASLYVDDPLRKLPTASALCGLLADFLNAVIDATPGALTLHCGAFVFRDRLIALTGSHRAGKSTLMARLTAEPDVAVFCDDVLPLDTDGNGIALGIAPRLRLPLPPNASELFHRHVAATLGPADDRYGYVCASTVARHGTTAPLSALVVLDRRADGPARLHRLEPDEAMHHLLAQNMGHLEDAGHAFRTALATVGKTACLKLVYSDLEDAVALLRRALGGDSVPSADVDVGPPLPFSPEGRTTPPPVEPDLSWSRAPDAAVRRVGTSAFLWRPQDTVLWQLNPVAEMVWAALEVPGSALDVAEVISEIFPDAPRTQMIDDIRGLLAEMAARDLVTSDPASA